MTTSCNKCNRADSHLHGCSECESLCLQKRELENQISEMRRDFESILIRCTEGDPKSDWLPVIAGISRKWAEKRSNECTCGFVDWWQHETGARPRPHGGDGKC